MSVAMMSLSATAATPCEDYFLSHFGNNFNATSDCNEVSTVSNTGIWSNCVSQATKNRSLLIATNQECSITILDHEKAKQQLTCRDFLASTDFSVPSDLAEETECDGDFYYEYDRTFGSQIEFDECTGKEEATDGSAKPLFSTHWLDYLLASRAMSTHLTVTLRNCGSVTLNGPDSMELPTEPDGSFLFLSSLPEPTVDEIPMNRSECERKVASHEHVECFKAGEEGFPDNLADQAHISLRCLSSDEPSYLWLPINLHCKGKVHSHYEEDGLTYESEYTMTCDGYSSETDFESFEMQAKSKALEMTDGCNTEILFMYSSGGGEGGEWSCGDNAYAISNPGVLSQPLYTSEFDVSLALGHASFSDSYEVSACLNETNAGNDSITDTNTSLGPAVGSGASTNVSSNAETDPVAGQSSDSTMRMRNSWLAVWVGAIALSTMLNMYT